MAVLASSRVNVVIRADNQRLVAADKPLKVAPSACMRKLLVLCNGYCQCQTTCFAFSQTPR